jgi:GntR family transcriptional regulator
MYEQLAERITELICSGVYAEGERLPPVREVAAAHALNPNTVQKSYQLLESRGLIYSIPAKGSYIAGETARKAIKVEAAKKFRDSAVYALRQGLEIENLRTALDTAYKEVNQDKAGRHAKEGGND